MARGACLPAAVLLAAACTLHSAFLTFSCISRRETLQATSAVAALAASTLDSQPVRAEQEQDSPYRTLSNNLKIVLDLQEAVNSGDRKAIMAAEKDFKRVNGYWRLELDRTEYNYMTDLTDKIMDAAYQDKPDQVKELYAKYLKKKELQIAKALPPPPKKEFKLFR
eukprot:TRINITY_DN31108_c0_g1_i1.p1 TRINITY_DN31108_c0_g1~~TRINITY_DN31108_c0_g1_i1.p1  ORF type:complete len:166 (-),score=37.08 TRINITY_DN31108_c0_g1_i1:28-525(-)